MLRIVEARFFTVRGKSSKFGKEEDYEPCGIGLELEVSVWTPGF